MNIIEIKIQCRPIQLGWHKHFYRGKESSFCEDYQDFQYYANQSNKGGIKICIETKSHYLVNIIEIKIQCRPIQQGWHRNLYRAEESSYPIKLKVYIYIPTNPRRVAAPFSWTTRGPPLSPWHASLREYSIIIS